MSTRNEQLTKLLAGNSRLLAPGTYDALSAKLVQEAGFDVVYIGSYGTSASCFGYPDVGLLSLDELAAHAKRIVGAVSLPVVADAEGGFHEPGNIWRTVRAFEDAGVSAIHIEDHAGGKHTDLPQQLIPLEEMLAKLRAALDARTDPQFRIIARTDAIWAMGDANEARRRVDAFAELGVDMVFPTGADGQFIRSLRAQRPLKVVAIETPDDAARPSEDTADLVINYGLCMYAASKAVLETLVTYRETRDVARVRDRLESAQWFEQRCDYHSFSERTRKYRLGGAGKRP